MIAISLFTAKILLFVLGCVCVFCAVLISAVKDSNYEISNVGDE